MRYVMVLYTHVVGLAVIRALGRKGVPIIALCYKECEMGKYSKYVKQRIKIPDPGTKQQEFIRFMIGLSSRFKKSLVIPTDDYTVVALSKNKKKLEQSYVVCVESWEKCRVFINKNLTYKLAGKLKISHPNTFYPRTTMEVDKLYRNGSIRFPVLLKPVQGHTFYDHFKKKMIEIDNKPALYTFFKKMKKLGVNVMVQELIPGKDDQGVNYNGFFVNGSPVVEFTAKKVRIEPPVYGSPRVIKSKQIPEIMMPGRKLMKSVNYTGFACIEFKQDERDRKYQLMEVNCRSNLSGALAVKCGINFPWIMYNHYACKKMTITKSFHENIFWIDISHDIRRFFKSRRQEKYSLKSYIKPYLSRNTFAVLSVGDPFPFIMRIAYLLRLILNFR